MVTASNSLRSSAFRSKRSGAMPQTCVSTCSTIDLFQSSASYRTPILRGARAGRRPLSVVPLLRGDVVGNWRMDATLLIRLQRGPKRWVATTWLEGVTEYGEGSTQTEATVDLIQSLGEYCESLRRREGKLGVSARRELAHLCRMLQRSTSVA